MATLTLKNICKKYDNGFEAVKDVNIEVNDSEFIALVEPSGCGKSTTLRMIAGLEDISSGEFYIDDKLVNNIESKDRDIAMVFQSYALYPHMTVYNNMAYALKLRKLPKKDIDIKVKKVAETLGLTELLNRKPSALSGGQRQRVALGRAIVRSPKVFLMDEPLSNLDAKLRGNMRTEIIRIHRKLNATTVYVTHDQTEAMTMADRIVVMKDGIVQQIGSPKSIYENPVNFFVAGFIGAPTINFIEGKLCNNEFYISDKIKLKVPEGIYTKLVSKGYENQKITLGIRPENISNDPNMINVYPDSTFELEINVAELLGAEYIIHTKIGEKDIKAIIHSREDIKSNDLITVAFDMNRAHFFDNDNGKNILFK